MRTLKLQCNSYRQSRHYVFSRTKQPLGLIAVRSAQVQRSPSEKAMASTSPDEILTRVEVGKPSATGTSLENIGKSRLLRAFPGQLDSSASRPPSVLKPSTR